MAFYAARGVMCVAMNTKTGIVLAAVAALTLGGSAAGTAYSNGNGNKAGGCDEAWETIAFKQQIQVHPGEFIADNGDRWEERQMLRAVYKKRCGEKKLVFKRSPWNWVNVDSPNQPRKRSD